MSSGCRYQLLPPVGGNTKAFGRVRPGAGDYGYRQLTTLAQTGNSVPTRPMTNDGTMMDRLHYRQQAPGPMGQPGEEGDMPQQQRYLSAVWFDESTGSAGAHTCHPYAQSSRSYECGGRSGWE